MDSKVLPIFAIILLNGIVMSLPTTSNNNEDRMFYKKARNGSEDTLDFTIEESQLEGLRDSLDDRGSGGQYWLGLGPGLGRSIVNSERKGEIEEAAIDRLAGWLAIHGEDRRLKKARRMSNDRYRQDEIDEVISCPPDPCWCPILGGSFWELLCCCNF